eukprot:791323-Karenia_brevis.AAC.1
MKENGRGSYLLDVNFLGGERRTITVERGAEDSVCPWEWGDKFGVQQGGRKLSFRTASGGPIEHYGEREVIGPVGVGDGEEEDEEAENEFEIEGCGKGGVAKGK